MWIFLSEQNLTLDDKVQVSQRGSAAHGMGAWCSLDIMLAF